MTNSLFLQSIVDRLEDSIERVQALSGVFDESSLNWRPDPKHWSCAQIFQHMLVASESYVPEIEKALSGKARSAADPEVVHSWFGRIVIRAAGPSGNTPVPKKLTPRPGPYRADIVEHWVSRHQEIISLARRAQGIDVSDIPMRNPFVAFVRMNLADFFEVLTAHAERHVAQIESLARHFPKAQPAGSTAGK